MTIRDRGPTRALSATLAAVTALGLARCNQDDLVPADDEFMGSFAPYAEGTPTEENKVIYEGQCNQEFINETENCVVQQVTFSGR